MSPRLSSINTTASAPPTDEQYIIWESPNSGQVFLPSSGIRASARPQPIPASLPLPLPFLHEIVICPRQKPNGIGNSGAGVGASRLSWLDSYLSQIVRDRQ